MRVIYEECSAALNAGCNVSKGEQNCSPFMLYAENADYKYAAFAVNNIVDKAIATLFNVKYSEGNVFCPTYSNNNELALSGYYVIWFVIQNYIQLYIRHAL